MGWYHGSSNDCGMDYAVIVSNNGWYQGNSDTPSGYGGAGVGLAKPFSAPTGRIAVGLGTWAVLRIS
jgi:hypothetical protein